MFNTHSVRRARIVILLVAFDVLITPALAGAAPPRKIVIDGGFDDWAGTPLYLDPEGDEHDTDHDQFRDIPSLVDHDDVDLLEFKFTHDKDALYAYFRAKGVIGRTQHESQGRAGRYYVIATIDVDNRLDTGYWLHEGGYYPTSKGYDMNFEVEFYNGAFNTGHYLNHGARNQAELDQAFLDQAQGFVRVLPGSYDFYTQWVYFRPPPGLPEQIILPNGDAIVWVQDRGPVYEGGLITIALSEDGHEAEMGAPFVGFMVDETGAPIMDLGKTITISLSLEASGELAPGQQWASDTGDYIAQYFLDGKREDVDDTGFVTATDVQLTINGALDILVPYNTDVNRDGVTNAVDVQLVILAALV